LEQDVEENTVDDSNPACAKGPSILLHLIPLKNPSKLNPFYFSAGNSQLFATLENIDKETKGKTIIVTKNRLGIK
jgi:hypothetical protein